MPDRWGYEQQDKITHPTKQEQLEEWLYDFLTDPKVTRVVEDYEDQNLIAILDEYHIRLEPKD